ncbi:unnamed protein product [Amoebophrya sp. A25]|nr:unnamed protein product [Amoebophrya sp. A25]|eukprot:GSA25T00027850001.1
MYRECFAPQHEAHRDRGHGLRALSSTCAAYLGNLPGITADGLRRSPLSSDCFQPSRVSGFA